MSAVPLVRYSEPFLKWTREYFQQMDVRTRKFITMHKALYPSYDIDRQYVSWKGGRGLARIEDSVDTTTQWLHKKAPKKTVYSDQKQCR